MEKNIIVETIGSMFSRFVGVLKKYGVLLSTWAVLLFVILYSVIINPFDMNKMISAMEKDRNTQHQESIDKRLIADQTVPAILKSLRLENGLTRVCLMEMHNSTENINNVSFLYMSMVYEDFDFQNDSIMSVSDFYQQQRTSDYTDVFNVMKTKGYVYLEDLDNYKDEFCIRMVRKVRHNGVKSIMLVPLFNGSRIDGILVMTSFNKTMDVKKIGSGLYKPVESIKSLIF